MGGELESLSDWFLQSTKVSLDLIDLHLSSGLGIGIRKGAATELKYSEPRIGNR
jgi:hypothetical protein